MIYKFMNERDKQFIIVRKTMPALRRSAYALIVDLMEEYGIYKYLDHNKLITLFEIHQMVAKCGSWVLMNQLKPSRLQGV